MAYTQQQYEKLLEAIASGAQTIQYGDKIIQLRSLNDIRSIKQEMERDLGIKKRGGRNLKTVYSKGL